MRLEYGAVMGQPLRCDVVVVGAGPAGAFAALNLARRGIGVRILEEHETVGVPVNCSGVVGREAMGVLGLDGVPVLGEVTDLVLVSPASIRVHYRPPSPLAVVVDRAGFDQRILAEAVRAGVAVETGRRVTRIGVAEDRVQVEAVGAGGGLSLGARVAILAVGPNYRLQEALGMGAPPRFLSTAQVEVAAPAVASTQVYFGRGVAPGSFAWVVPFQRDGRRTARVGVGATRAAGVYLRDLLSCLRRQGLIGEVLQPARRWPIPLAALPRTYADRVLAVGDAAGQTKPTTGGGIYYGLLCAEIAGAVAADALAAGDCSARFLSRYDREWRSRLHFEMLAGRFIRYLFERLEDAEIDQVFRVINSDGILREVRGKVRFDWHGETIRCLLRHPILGEVLLKGLLRGRGGARRDC